MICFAHYLWTGNWVGRIAYAAILAVGLYALALTGSRSGMVGLAVVLGAIWLRSKHKVALALVAVGHHRVERTSHVVRPGRDRYRSLVDSSSKNAGTAASRMVHVKKAFRVALRRPLFGHGVGTSREALANFAGVDQPAHNLYAEVAIELGFIGLGFFLVFIWLVARELWRLQRHWRARPRAPTLARTGEALLIFLVMNLLFSLASYGLTSYGGLLRASPKSSRGWCAKPPAGGPHPSRREAE